MDTSNNSQGADTVTDIAKEENQFLIKQQIFGDIEEFNGKELCIECNEKPAVVVWQNHHWCDFCKECVTEQVALESVNAYSMRFAK